MAQWDCKHGKCGFDTHSLKYFLILHSGRQNAALSSIELKMAENVDRNASGLDMLRCLTDRRRTHLRENYIYLS